MLIETKIVDQITILPDSQIWVRTATVILRDGTEVVRTYHRHVLAPGENYSNEDARVKMVATVLHTPSVVQAYQDALQLVDE